ncbi:hypothetical protein ACWIUD_07370 [Helicobacter sp. 23-1044]
MKNPKNPKNRAFIDFALKGALAFAFTALLANATELRDICKNGNCTITTKQDLLTNHGAFSTSDQITIQTTIKRFINYGHITSKGLYQHTANNYLHSLTNYGTMNGFWSQNQAQTITIENYGTIFTNTGSYLTSESNGALHFVFEATGNHIKIGNYAIKIDEAQSEFNAFEKYESKDSNKNSHLIMRLKESSISFKDATSKLILDFGENFEFGAKYALDKLIVNKANDAKSTLEVPFWRLAAKSSIYQLSQSGSHFIVTIDTSKSEIATLGRANARAMNNLFLISDAMIYPRKISKSAESSAPKRRIRKNAEISQNLHKSSLRTSEASAAIQKNRLPRLDFVKSRNDEMWLDSALFAQNDAFFYRTPNRRINRNLHTKDSAKIAESTAESTKNYHFVFTPFVNHNYFFDSGELSGFDFGFVSAFSGKIAESSAFGAHFAMSYGALGDTNALQIKSMNFNGALHYKLDLPYATHFRVRGDFFYFLNELQTMFFDAKPNNFGFGASASYGKDFDFGNAGILRVEGGLEYKGLYVRAISLGGGDYSDSLQNMLFADVSVDYGKYFHTSSGVWGVNAMAGVKGNALFALKNGSVVLNGRAFDLLLEDDKILGYMSAGVSYVLQKRAFDVEFSANYYGNFGDSGMSNGGGVEIRVGF